MIAVAMPRTLRTDYLRAIAVVRDVLADGGAVPRAEARAGTGGGTEPGKLAAVIDELYARWFTGWQMTPNGETTDRDLVEVLRAAHGASDQWEQGWEVMERRAHGSIVVRKGRERRLLHALDYVNTACPGLVPDAGEKVLVTARRDSLGMRKGDWVAFTPSWPMSREPLLRLYWNLSPQGASPFVSALTRRISGDLPYMLKLPRTQHDYSRVDSAVVYLPRARLDDVKDELFSLYADVSACLRSEVPPLTKRLAAGVALAEDTGDTSESYGYSRCRLVAEGVMAAVAEDLDDDEKLLGMVVRAFDDAGVPPERPYVNSRNSRDYSLDLC